MRPIGYPGIESAGCRVRPELEMPNRSQPEAHAARNASAALDCLDAQVEQRILGAVRRRPLPERVALRLGVDALGQSRGQGVEHEVGAARGRAVDGGLGERLRAARGRSVGGAVRLLSNRDVGLRDGHILDAE